MTGADDAGTIRFFCAYGDFGEAWLYELTEFSHCMCNRSEIGKIGERNRAESALDGIGSIFVQERLLQFNLAFGIILRFDMTGLHMEI